MNLDGKHLTAAAAHEAGQDNYTWHKGGGDYPTGAGFVFMSKDDMAEQVYQDYPAGFPLPAITGWPKHLGKNTVIGGDGFGWYGDPPKRFPHIGGVTFGEGVEIGSNTTIDRGALGDTVIGNHVKIDNGVHVGHNAVIGDSSILTAHCVIGGSAKIGKNVWVGLGAVVKNQIVVGDGAVIGMGAIVVKDVAPLATVVGNPARPL